MRNELRKSVPSGTLFDFNQRFALRNTNVDTTSLSNENSHRFSQRKTQLLLFTVHSSSSQAHSKYYCLPEILFATSDFVINNNIYIFFSSYICCPVNCSLFYNIAMEMFPTANISLNVTWRINRQKRGKGLRNYSRTTAAESPAFKYICSSESS